MAPQRHDDVVFGSDYHPRALARARRNGSLVRVEHGAYLPAYRLMGEDWVVEQRRHLARCLADMRRLSPDTVLSHLSAAVVHGLWVPHNDIVHVTQQFAGNSPLRSDVLIRHQRPIPPEDVTVIDGLRVTSLDRTVVDCVTMVPMDWGFAVADSALRLLLAPERHRPESALRDAVPLRARWRAYLDAHGPRRGCRRAREILARANPMSESPGESRIRAIALAEGLPPPTCQFPVPVGRRTFYADFGWRLPGPGTGGLALVEFDGQGKYGVEGAKDAEVLRHKAIEKTGADIVRFTGDDLLLEKRHTIAPRLFDLVPDLARDRDPVTHLLPQPAHPRRRRP